MQCLHYPADQVSLSPICVRHGLSGYDNVIVLGNLVWPGAAVIVHQWHSLLDDALLCHVCGISHLRVAQHHAGVDHQIVVLPTL